MNKPIKRDELLEPLSHDHHHGLLFCRRIKQGLKKEVSAQRIITYCRFFYKRHLDIHFKEEEELLFPLMGIENTDVLKALEDHKRIHHLIFEEKDVESAIKMLSGELTDHIRFEERILFNKIQDISTKEQLQQVHKALHNRDTLIKKDQWSDKFWE